MNETNLTRIITDLAGPLAASLGLHIWGLEAAYAKRPVIRLYVEGDHGVNIDKCAELSRLLGLALDVEDTFPGAYVLEVSSPGLERTFFTPEQFAAAKGQTVEVALFEPVDAYPGRKKLLGTLTGTEDGTFTMELLDALPSAAADGPVPVTFAWDDVKKAKLVYFLPEQPKAKKTKQTKSPKKPARISDAENGEGQAAE